MKKYVKTDKHITSSESYKRAKEIVKKYPGYATLDLIVDESDDLKDLCDYVVVEWINGLPTVYDLEQDVDFHTFERADFDQVVSFTEKENNNIANIYGAMWNKHGIECVARLNRETGELELI